MRPDAQGARITKVVPPTILGLIGGVVIYYLFLLAGLGDHIGPAIGAIPFGWPTPHYLFDFGRTIVDPQFLQMAPVMVAGAASLAIVASLDSLLCARLIQSDSGQRVHSNRELVRVGVGNMVAASFGGIANGINLGSSFANPEAERDARSHWRFTRGDPAGRGRLFAGLSYCPAS